MMRTSLSLYISLVVAAAPALSMAAPKSGAPVSKKLAAEPAPAAAEAPNPFARIAAARGVGPRTTAPVAGTSSTTSAPAAKAKAAGRIDISPARGVAIRKSIDEHTGSATRLESEHRTVSQRVRNDETAHQEAETKLADHDRRARDYERAETELAQLRPKLVDARANAASLRDKIPPKSAAKKSKRAKGDDAAAGGEEQSLLGRMVSAMSMTFGRPSDAAHADERAANEEAEATANDAASANGKQKKGKKDKGASEDQARAEAWQRAYDAWSGAQREIDSLIGSIERAETSLRHNKPGAFDPSREQLETNIRRAGAKVSASRAELSKIATNLRAAEAARDSATADLHAWTAAVHQAEAEHVYGVLDQLKAAPPQVDARWSSQFYSVPKQAATRSSENRDVISVIEKGGVVRLAVADGSSVGEFAGQWAQLVAHRFTGQLQRTDAKMPGAGSMPALNDKDSLKAWLAPVHEEWYRLVQAAGPIARRAVTMTKGMTTLVGVELRDEGGSYSFRAEGAGDSNLFIVRKGSKKVEAWPITKAADFNSSPAALSFALDTNVAHAWKTHEGSLQPGDEIFVATDALAKWVLLGGAKAHDRLQRLAAVKDQSQYATLVAEARKDVVDDDTTFAHFVVPGGDAATPVKALKAKAPSAKGKE